MNIRSAFVPAAIRATVAALATSSAALAGSVGGVTVTFTQDTVLSTTTVRATGSLDTVLFGTPVVSQFGSAPWVSPGAGSIYAVPNVPTLKRFFINGFTPPAYGSGGLSSGTYLGPDVFAIEQNGTVGQLSLPTTYVANSPLDAAVRFNGTFATLGIAPGIYSITLPGAQVISYQFATIPAPGAAAVLGLSGLLAARRRR
ncbi:MAG: hypothetical protein K2Q20_08410 [Phycisphaerales bacterium]|nr:hypothetical protein [Phycisphaerales bacterium]